MTSREKEFQRIKDCANSIADDAQMLFACLVGDDPKEVSKLKYERFEDAGRKIPAEYVEPAKALYRVAANEFEKFFSQRLCFAIENFLATVMPPAALEDFKKKTPMRFPIKTYANILEELADERPDLF